MCSTSHDYDCHNLTHVFRTEVTAAPQYRACHDEPTRRAVQSAVTGTAIHRALYQPVLGNYLVRRPPQRRSLALDEFTQVRGGFLSHAFTAAREKAGAYAELPAEERPAFRDLRAFGSWLHLEAGHPVATCRR